MDFLAQARRRQALLERASTLAATKQAQHDAYQQLVLSRGKLHRELPSHQQTHQQHQHPQLSRGQHHGPDTTTVHMRQALEESRAVAASKRALDVLEACLQHPTKRQRVATANNTDVRPDPTVRPEHAVRLEPAVRPDEISSTTPTTKKPPTKPASSQRRPAALPGQVVKVRGSKRVIDLREPFMKRFAEDIHATTLEHPLAIQAADAPPHVKLLRGGLKDRQSPPGHKTMLDSHYWVHESLLEQAFGSDWKHHPMMAPLTVIPNEGASFRKNGILRKTEGKPFELWGRDPARPKCIGLPPGWGLSMFGLPTVDMRVKGAPLKYKYSLAPHFKARPEQRIAIARTLKVLNSGWGRALMIEDCAMGKTLQMMMLFCHFGVRFLFVVPSNIATQTVETFRTSLIAIDPVTGERVEPSIHLWKGSASAPKPHDAWDITIVSHETLKLTKVPPQTFLQYGFMGVDEGHTVITEKGTAMFSNFYAAKVVCVTATPMRLDNTGYVLPFYFGPIAVNITRELLHRHPETQDRVMAIKVLQITSGMELDSADLVHMTPAQREDLLALDPTYTAEAVWAVAQAKAAGCKEIYVLTRRLNHLRSVWLALAKYFRVPVDAVPLVYGGKVRPHGRPRKHTESQVTMFVYFTQTMKLVVAA